MNAVYFAFEGVLLHCLTLSTEWDPRLTAAIDSIPLRPSRVDLAKVSEWQPLLEKWVIERQEDVGEFLLHLCWML